MNRSNKNLLKKYNDNGWVKIKNFLSKKNIIKINESLDKFINSKMRKYSGRDINFVEKK